MPSLTSLSHLLFTLICTASAGVLAPQVGEQVDTTSGPVKGHAAPWPANSGISEYLGIPYAEPPIGQLRFVAPQMYKLKGPIDAADYVSTDTFSP